MSSSNGQRLTGRAQVQPGDRVAIATFAFLFTGEALEPVGETGRVHVEVRSLYKASRTASGGVKHLLDQVNPVFEPGEVAVIFGSAIASADAWFIAPVLHG
jgi:hypothetical protein